MPAMHRVEQALRAAPKGVMMILMEELNAWLGDLRGKCEEKLVTALDLFQPKMSPTLSFSRMYRKSFIYRRNRTNSQ